MPGAHSQGGSGTERGIEPDEDQRPMVSVVMIFFQAERFLNEAVCSVVGQTVASFELLLVDDGSTDRGPAIAQEWAERDPRVRIIRHPDAGNHGMSASRNVGVRAATADLVAFLDADDVWEPDHLERQLAALAAHPDVDMVCAPALRWHSWNAPDAVDEATRLAFAPGSVVAPPKMLTAFLDDGSSAVPMCALLVRRDVLMAIGGAEADFRDLFEDAALLSKLFLRATAVLSGDVTSRYRQHDESACARSAAAGTYRSAHPSPSRQRYLDWLGRYVERVGCTDQRLHSAIARERAAYRPAWLFPLKHRFQLTADRLRPSLPPGLRHTVGVARGAVSGTGVGYVRLGSLRRLQPFSRDFGFSRGLPIDRYYIEQFLEQHRGDVAGRVLEIGDDTYTRRFGGDRVTTADVLHVHAGNPRATFVGDLAEGAGLPSESFDCIVLTQTLHLVYDMRAAVDTLFRVLRPGGVVLATVPGISQVAADEWRHEWHWSLTATSAQRLFADVFGASGVQVGTYGNVLTAASFLYGVTAGELKADELDHHDEQYPLVVTARATRSAPASSS